MLLIINENGWRLCNDGRWRDFALSGSVKQYKTVGHAKHRAEHIGGKVVKVPKGMSVDASGTVIETIPCPDKPGYVNYKHHRLSEFVVYPGPDGGGG
jgi:hypothetical protein